MVCHHHIAAGSKPPRGIGYALMRIEGAFCVETLVGRDRNELTRHILPAYAHCVEILIRRFRDIGIRYCQSSEHILGNRTFGAWMALSMRDHYIDW